MEINSWNMVFKFSAGSWWLLMLAQYGFYFAKVYPLMEGGQFN
jgi:hypothetical protein